MWNSTLPRELHNHEQSSFGPGSSAGPGAENWTQYDVFLNHRGPDLKKSFVSHLEKELRQVGCVPFLDAKSLVKGQHAFRSINKALIGVLVHVAIFSPRYVESKYCLNELCEMLASKKPVIPVFYDVEPENLRWTNEGPFVKAFSFHLERGRDQDVLKWRAALVEATAITGFRRLDYVNDSKLIEKIVAVVLENLPTPPLVAPARHPVGLKESSAQVMKLLHKMGDNVGIVGICGMGGIGKTTLAREVYNQRMSSFQNRCFLKDVKEAKGVAVMDLQRQMVTNLFHEDATKRPWEFSFWFAKIRYQKVLLVIDDINERKQFDELIPNLKQLAPGSQVLITSREWDILNNIMLDIPQSIVYHMHELNFSNSLELFVWCAFRKNNIDVVDASFHGVVKEITNACGGLPLALEVMGGYLADKMNLPNDDVFWKKATFILRGKGEIITKLQISYDELLENDKRMFLDIACFMLGHPKDAALEVWESNDYYASSSLPSLKNLINKNLVKINGDGQLNMHDLLRDMGRKIVMEKASNKPEMQSHIWDPIMAAKILQKKLSSNEVLALSVFGVNPYIACKAELYAKMTDLRYLSLDFCAVKGDFSAWSEELRWLQWKYSPHEELPLSLKLPNLALLDLSTSLHLTRVWARDFELEFPCKELRMLILKGCNKLEELPHHINKLVKLKVLNLEGCRGLKSLPNSLEDLTELENINLSGCENVTNFPNFGCLGSLRKLNLRYCRRLTKLSDSFSNLSNLEELDLSWCYQLKMLPSFICGLKKLRVLWMCFMAIEELLDDFGLLHSLIEAYFENSQRLTKFPNSFSNLVNLEHLDLAHCILLKKLPPSICGLKKLKSLIICHTTINQLPKNFGQLQRLTKIDLSSCKWLTKLPDSFSNLSNLEELQMSDCELLQELPPIMSGLKKLRILFLRNTTIKVFQDFGKLLSLTHVDFSSCKKLQSLGESFGCLRNLQKLNLRGCECLMQLPKSFLDLADNVLVNLDMKNCKKMKSLCYNFGCFKNLQKLKLEGCQSLMQLPQSFSNSSTLEKLNLRDCKQLQSLGENFGNLSNLEELYLSRCYLLQKLLPSISKLKKLRRLRINYMLLEELPEEFGQLHNLVYADFEGCIKWQSLCESFGYLRNLRELKLSGCESLVQLLQSFSNLSTLKLLNISYCRKLKSLCDNFGCLTNLLELKLRGCKSLVQLPQSFSNLVALNKLDMNYCNQLQSLGESFGINLSNLKELNMSRCYLLQKLPPSIIGLKKLRKLCINYTLLEELPEEFGQLQSLTCVDFEGCNKLQSLCRSFGCLTNLQDLKLKDCESLVQLPQSFSNLYFQTLRWLDSRALLPGKLKNLCNNFEYLYLGAIIKGYESLEQLST